MKKLTDKQFRKALRIINKVFAPLGKKVVPVRMSDAAAAREFKRQFPNGIK